MKLRYLEKVFTKSLMKCTQNLFGTEPSLPCWSETSLWDLINYYYDYDFAIQRQMENKRSKKYDKNTKSMEMMRSAAYEYKRICVYFSMKKKIVWKNNTCEKKVKRNTCAYVASLLKTAGVLVINSNV